MDTFHRLAGVTESSNRDPRPSQPFEAPPTLRDPETSSQLQNDTRGSRASLPLDRRPSHKSFRSSQRGNSRSGSPNRPPLPSPSRTQQHRQERRSHESAGSRSGSEGEEDFPWGQEAQTTRVIRVRRDWLTAGDLYPQFQNLYPEILDPLVTDEDFRFLISNLNSRLKATFSPFTTRAWVDAVIGAATGYVWEDLGLTGVKRGMKGIERFLDGWNGEGREVRVVQVRRTGFMALDFVVPDPGIDGEGNGEGGIGPAE
ncbi:hypothetical protein LTR37_008151 [Vermiconidia calcicola]|uniref:Uncharacterized protein n=1 Tax=Vermiconidia calcicola TaxID=1690605 RepID=A0ACC3NBC9_9PEZI|nr:hypothetical protein LTR37_008151 [Vermiconidia calcicola]